MHHDQRLASGLSLELIDNFSRLLEIEPKWSSFARTIAGITPFQLPEWLLTWWEHFGNGQLRVLAFRENDAMAGIVPCFRHQWNGLRQITLIGSGISDYLEPAIDRRHCPAILARLREQMEADSDWDICDWQDLSGDSPLRGFKSHGNFEIALTPDLPCSEIRLEGTFDEFQDARPKGLKRNLRRYREKAEAAGSIRFQVANEARPELMKALIDLHDAKWQSRGKPGMIQANGSAEFLCDVTRKFERGDMLRFFSLRFRDQIAALILAFPFRNTMFGYLSAFDPEHEALGLGRTLLLEAICYCYQNGFQAWNFLRGDEPYKFWWGAQIIPKCRVRLVRTSS